jgi:hypothetical protein
VRALGEPAGSRRLTDERHTAERDERRAAPSRRSRPSARPDDDGEDDGRTTDERTSPFPYADDFDEWVADETAAPDGGQRRREPLDRDA